MRTRDRRSSPVSCVRRVGRLAGRRRPRAPPRRLPPPQRSRGGSALVLNGHVDTIPIGVSWPPRREGGWVCGRGAEDMKGGLVAMVTRPGRPGDPPAGVAALRRDVQLSGVVGHETPVGNKEGPLRLIERLRSGPSRRTRSWSARAPRRSGGPASAPPSTPDRRLPGSPVHTVAYRSREPGARSPPCWAPCTPWTPDSAPPATTSPVPTGSTSGSSAPGLPRSAARPPARHRNRRWGPGAAARQCGRKCSSARRLWPRPDSTCTLRWSWRPSASPSRSPPTIPW